MTSAATKWLPLNAAMNDEVRKRLDTAVCAWSSAWFGKTSVRLSKLEKGRRGHNSIDGGAGWQRYRSRLAISVSKRAVYQLLDLALDANLNQILLTETDRLLLDAFAEELLGDLTTRVEAALEIEGEDQRPPRSVIDAIGQPGGLIANLTDNQGSPLLAIAVPLEAIMPLYMATFPPARRASEPLQRLSAAVAPESLSLEVNLGQADLSMSELKGLAPGDVLVLDTLLSDSAAVCLPGGGAVAARAKLIETAGELALVFEPNRM